MNQSEFSGDSLAAIKAKIIAAKPGMTGLEKAAAQKAAEKAAYEASRKAGADGGDY